MSHKLPLISFYKAPIRNTTQSHSINLMQLYKAKKGLKKAAIYCHVCKNNILHFKGGGRVYFSKKDLQEQITHDARGSPTNNNIITLSEVLFPQYKKKLIIKYL